MHKDKRLNDYESACQAEKTFREACIRSIDLNIRSLESLQKEQDFHQQTLSAVLDMGKAAFQHLGVNLDHIIFPRWESGNFSSSPSVPLSTQPLGTPTTDNLGDVLPPPPNPPIAPIDLVDPFFLGRSRFEYGRLCCYWTNGEQ
jgi:hypothetical protein